MRNAGTRNAKHKENAFAGTISTPGLGVLANAPTEQRGPKIGVEAVPTPYKGQDNGQNQTGPNSPKSTNTWGGRWLTQAPAALDGCLVMKRRVQRSLTALPMSPPAQPFRMLVLVRPGEFALVQRCVDARFETVGALVVTPCGGGGTGLVAVASARWMA